MKHLSLRSALGLAALYWSSSVAALDDVTKTFATKILVDEFAPLARCALVAPIHETQLHRLVQTPSTIYEERTVRHNRNDLQELAHLSRDATNHVFIEIFGASEDTVARALRARCPHGVVESDVDLSTTTSTAAKATAAATAPTIKKIVDSGDPKNRIDIVFMGDGYTAAESTKFFTDMQRLTNEMFASETFAQYLPLFNVWAVHQPSIESGIGVGGRPKNTAFGLYRDGTELRGIYTNKAAEARRVCALVGANACDFPSLIANDDYYGGLGGEFVIATRSPTSGTIVLRHEMGHNFGKVGEEYDGGSVYSGANAATSLSAISWKHWLTTNASVVREEKAALTFSEYMWYDLKSGPYTMTFPASGTYKRWMLVVAVSGAPTSASLAITFDGKRLAWTARGDNDRTFYTWFNTNGLAAGTHTLVVSGNGPFTNAVRQQLCSVDVTEYMDERLFSFDNNDAVSAYPTWDASGRKTFRPSNEKCLMRNMLSTTFCNVCVENMWLQFFARVQLIDSVVVTNATRVQVNVLPLGQLRVGGTTTNNETLTVEWRKAGVEQVQLRDRFAVDVAATPGGATGQWTVRVTFATASVRKDPKKLLQSEKAFTI